MIFQILIQNKMAIAVLFFKKILKNLLTFCGDSIIFIVATIKGVKICHRELDDLKWKMQKIQCFGLG